MTPEKVEWACLVSGDFPWFRTEGYGKVLGLSELAHPCAFKVHMGLCRLCFPNTTRSTRQAFSVWVA